MMAVIINNLKLVKYLKNWTSSVNFQDKKGNTALHYAVVRENILIIKALLKFDKINPYIENNNQEKCFDLAISLFKKKVKYLIVKKERK